MEFLLVQCQVVALSQKHFPKGSLSQLPFQHNVVSLDVLDNFKTQQDRENVTLKVISILVQQQNITYSYVDEMSSSKVKDASHPSAHGHKYWH